MRAKTIHIPTFTEFLREAPEELQKYVEKSKTMPQSIKWHPEFFVYNHLVIVFNRARRTNDINFWVAAFMHDLGKMDSTVQKAENVYNSIGHELISTRLVEKYKDWIESLGADYDIVHYIVKQHMRAKQIDVMRRSKQNAFRSHPYFKYVNRFTEFDDMHIDYKNDIDD
jgi:hypothetical protein